MLPMPWLVIQQLPILEHALPARLMVFAFLIVAVITALWFSDSATSLPLKAIVAAISWCWPAAQSFAGLLDDSRRYAAVFLRWILRPIPLSPRCRTNSSLGRSGHEHAMAGRVWDVLQERHRIDGLVPLRGSALAHRQLFYR